MLKNVNHMRTGAWNLRRVFQKLTHFGEEEDTKIHTQKIHPPYCNRVARRPSSEKQKKRYFASYLFSQ